MEEKLAKKKEYLSNYYRGRPDMKRQYYEKKSNKKKVVKTVKVDDDEKYFNVDYELGKNLICLIKIGWEAPAHLEGEVKTNHSAWYHKINNLFNRLAHSPQMTECMDILDIN